MKRELDISPMMVTKAYDKEQEREIRISYIIIENGPRLMNMDKEYTDVFNKLIEEIPSIRTASFYNSSYTHYKITMTGVNDKHIHRIKEIIMEESNKKERR